MPPFATPTRRIRYNCIDCSDVTADNHDGLNIYEQEILKVIEYEGHIPRIAKWNGSDISLDVEETDTAGHCRVEKTIFPAA